MGGTENEGLISPTCLREAFTLQDSKSAKRQSCHQHVFDLLGSARVEAACTMLVTFTRGLNFIKNLLTAFTLVGPKSVKNTVKS